MTDEVNGVAQEALELHLAASACQLWPTVGGDEAFQHREVSVLVSQRPAVLSAARTFGQDAVFRWTPDAWQVVTTDGDVVSSSGWELIEAGPLPDAVDARPSDILWYPHADTVLIEPAPQATRRAAAARDFAAARTVGDLYHVDQRHNLGLWDRWADVSWSPFPDEQTEAMAEEEDFAQAVQQVTDHVALENVDWPHPHDDDSFWPDEITETVELCDGWPQVPLTALSHVLAGLRRAGLTPRRAHPGYVPDQPPAVAVPSRQS